MAQYVVFNLDSLLEEGLAFPLAFDVPDPADAVPPYLAHWTTARSKARSESTRRLVVVDVDNVATTIFRRDGWVRIDKP